MSLVGVNATTVDPQGLIDFSFNFEGGKKTFHEEFVVLNDPQVFDVLLSDKFLRETGLVQVNVHLLPLRALTQGMLPIFV